MKITKRKILCLCLVLAMLLSVCGCGIKEQGSIVLSFDDVTITLGSSKIQELSSKGFEVYCESESGDFPLGDANRLPAKTALDNKIYFVKNGAVYAYAYIYNLDEGKRTFEQCTIYAVSFCLHSEENASWAKQNVIINGIDFYGMTEDAVKESMKDYNLSSRTEPGILRFEDTKGIYAFCFNQDSGTVEEVIVETQSKGLERMMADG